ncbi:hypothetical protein FA743_10930 [Paracoccus gahaiensis]|uniref:Uncharacterized protein n=1 Tax=Paracoccus gahaiensis TaxID=1706839 RepID=A0A4U0RAZ5_9RHOB|nr:hypothetical protein [Paracoccus gahaiensis]TJZ91602.1 hypothetical protein FA743_10930 [Paracoccus gahaiensis]
MTTEQRASATDTGLPVINRRSLFKAAPAALLVGAMPAVSMAEASHTPVIRAYLEWKTYSDWLNNGTGDIPDEDFDVLVERRYSMELAMFDLPSQDLRDATLKLMAFTDGGSDFSDDFYNTGMRLVKELGNMALSTIGEAA